MYRDDDERFYVGELDTWLSYESLHDGSRTSHYKIEAQNERKNIAVTGQRLFNGKVLRRRDFEWRGIEIGIWETYLSEAELALKAVSSAEDCSTAFLSHLIRVGLSYSTQRYSRMEGVPSLSAKVAILQYGFKALLYEYLDTEPSLRTGSAKSAVSDALQAALRATDEISYDRVSIVARAISLQNSGRRGLDREALRKILSLGRLHFLYREVQGLSAGNVLRLIHQYDTARCKLSQEWELRPDGIKNWRMRHLHPIWFYFPRSLRDSIHRLVSQCTATDNNLDIQECINELTLIYCERHVMRRHAKY